MSCAPSLSPGFGVVRALASKCSMGSISSARNVVRMRATCQLRLRSPQGAAARLPWLSSSPALLGLARPAAARHRTLRHVCSATAAPLVEQQAAAIESKPRVGMTKAAPTFQEAIARLQEYWSSVGCIVWLPHNTEVGAGTMNPATFLRVLGPEPWNVCYPEPSIRPDDSRYGDNPNRVQRHTQFQVILKPDPGNSQELYLGSLEALGIDTRAHDVRFVEDNWESPVLGAWGLGWEVWLDGMEVTQFTYFQQAGGKVLEAPAVEITYGLERILMALQGVNHFRDIRYNDAVTYGELFLQNEYEMSVYNLDEADVLEQRQRFGLFEREAKRMLAKRLPIPAYDLLLKLSHTFNILDARGAVGVTERANCFAAMRALAREVTSLWMARREELGHPLGLVAPAIPPTARAPAAATASTPRTLVLELGSEELPPDDVASAIQQLSDRVPAMLTKLRLSHTGVRVEGTPRRLAVIVSELAARQAAEETKVRGPPVKAAYAPDGKPTKALEGFCRKNGVDAGAVFVEADAKGTEYVWATVRDSGRTATEALCEELPGLVAGLSFRKSMRWRGDTAYSRPLRWLLALHGATVLPFCYAGLQASDVTRVLRNAPSSQLRVGCAEDYEQLLASQHISLGVEARSEAIWRDVQRAAAEVGGVVPESTRSSLLPEVLHLVESPTVLRGTFGASFLALPQEVLVTVMRKHQRYFPVFEAGEHGRLMPHFITVANGAVDVATVAHGNGAVLRARFEDATFFYNEDLRHNLEEFRPRLSGTLFQKELGSLLDKTERAEKLVEPLAIAMGLQDAVPVARQAAHLARADLASSTVMEMTELAGVMGRHYALKQGLPAEVAEAIFESVLPRQAGDQLPSSPAGVLVAVADRLDSLVGLFAAGCGPTSANDQYGLRRSAYGMLQALLANKLSLSLRRAVDAGAEVQPIAVPPAVRSEVVEFVVRRLEQLLVDSGVPAEAVRAVLNERGDDPSLAAVSAEALRVELEAGEGGRLRRVMAALARPTRILRKEQVDPSWVVNPAKFQLPAEGALHAAATAVRSAVHPSMALGDFLAACEPLVAPIDAFFVDVIVMAEDEGLRRNRQALLRDIADLPRGILDLTQLPGF